MADAPLSGDDIALDPELLKTLASDSRRDILRLLKQRRMTLTELANALSLGKATVLEHLKKLQDALLIVRREDERLWVYYELTPRGRRVVTPGKTRFYIVMAATAAGALLVGVILTLAFTHAQLGGDHGPKAFGGVAPVEAQGDLVVYRGLTADATLALSQSHEPVAGTLFVDGTPYATDDAGALRFDAAQLDALPSGNHTLAFLPTNGTAREPVAGFLDVRDVQPAITPLVLMAGRTTDVQLSFADPDAPVPPTVQADGVSLATTPVAPGTATFTLRPTASGTLQLHVGRLAPVEAQVAADIVPSLGANGTLAVRTSAGAALADVRVFLGGAPLGATDANGTLPLPASPDGERELRLVSAQGEVSRSLVFAGGNATFAPPRVSLEGNGGFAGSVRNDGAAPVALTVQALVDERVSASALVVVPANSSAPFSLAVRDAPAGAHVGAIRALALVDTPAFVLDNDGNAQADGGNASSAPSAPTSHDVALGDVRPGGSAVVARIEVGTLRYAAPSPAAGASVPSPAPKVPAPGVGLALVAALVVAAALRRGKR